MEKKKVYIVKTNYLTCKGICENDVTIVMATSEESAVKKAAEVLRRVSICEYVGYGYAYEAHIFEAD